jgi:hypothetical protein
MRGDRPPKEANRHSGWFSYFPCPCPTLSIGGSFQHVVAYRARPHWNGYDFKSATRCQQIWPYFVEVLLDQCDNIPAFEVFRLLQWSHAVLVLEI